MAKRETRRKEMERWFQKREREGWSLRELAERAGIPEGTVSWWSHELRKQKRAVREATDGTSGFSLLVAAEEPSDVVPAEAVRPIRIRLRNGTEVDVSQGVDACDLTTVLDVLEARC